jgi:hypothetical protein
MTPDGRSSVALDMNASGPPADLFELPSRAFHAKQHLLGLVVCWIAPS